MSGTIKFGTDGWRAIIGKDFITENVARVAKATADWVLQHNSNPAIAVGFDCRFGGSLFAQTAINVFCAHNIKVYYDTNFVSTPMISLAANKLNCELGVIFTASHNPPSYNGYKLKSKHGGPLVQKYITEVENLIPEKYEVKEHSLEHWVEAQMLEYVDFETMYFNHAAEYFDLDAIGDAELVVAYDAMYGAGQAIFPRLMPHADLLHCEYNPSFYGQAPEPIHKNLLELSEYIKQTRHIDIALATDGDADRIGLYNRKGEFVDAHHIILLLIHVLHKYKGLGGKVVIAFSVSNKVKKLCAHYGLPFEVTKIGFKYICEIMQHEDVLVGGEESGGIAVKGHIPERDGIWDGLVLVEHIAKNNTSLEALIEEVYAIVGKFSYNRLDLHLEESKKQEIVANCKAGKYTKFGDINVTGLEDIDGWKYNLQDEEILMIRASGTEPVLRVYAEASSAERVEEILIKAKAELLGVA
jgi:phosphomannomutase